MRLPKFLSLITCITTFSLVFVWQQAQIFRFAYVGQKSQIKFQDLLDKNARLRYNIDREFSLINIGNRICEDTGFQMPDTYRLVKSTTFHPEGLNKTVRKAANRQTLLARIFGIKRQAEARVINPSTELRVNGELSRTINPSIPLGIDDK